MSGAHGRRTRRPLPAPYQPGVGVRPDALALTDERPMLWACDLFDAGCYWEAHEVWESLWRQHPRASTEARLLQGLLLLAGALLKRRAGAHEAAADVFERGVEAIEEVVQSDGDVAEGIDLLQLVASVDDALHGGPAPLIVEEV